MHQLMSSSQWSHEDCNYFHACFAADEPYGKLTNPGSTLTSLCFSLFLIPFPMKSSLKISYLCAFTFPLHREHLSPAEHIFYLCIYYVLPPSHFTSCPSSCSKIPFLWKDFLCSLKLQQPLFSFFVLSGLYSLVAVILFFIHSCVYVFFFFFLQTIEYVVYSKF